MLFSKQAIDQIDSALANCYRLTHDELDFVLNYDIKYRIGQDLLDQENGA